MLVSAVTLVNSYCALAHGRVLDEKILSREEMRSLAAGEPDGFSAAETAMMDLARKVVSDASSVTREDVERLRQAGLGETEIFDVVATAARKPAFFDDATRGVPPVKKSRIVEGSNAACLEALLGSGGRSVMYVGDNPEFDAAPARRYGWVTALVVPELAPASPAGPWGPPLHEAGRPSWFASLVTRYADAYAPGIHAFLELAPDARLTSTPHPLALTHPPE